MVNWPNRIRCSDPGRRLITWSISYDGLSGPAMMAHVYGPAAEGRNDPPVIWLTEKNASVPNPIVRELIRTAKFRGQITPVKN
jgi:hypothetical protein